MANVDKFFRCASATAIARSLVLLLSLYNFYEFPSISFDKSIVVLSVYVTSTTIYIV